jgi:CheY-like chemotaxis protein
MSSDDYILIVEPDEDLRDTLVEFLYEEGYASCAASTGAEALSFLGAAPAPCLVLVDEHATEGRDAGLVTALRALPALAHIPICALAANERLAPLEFDDVMKKPIDVRDLLRVVDHWCRKGFSETTSAPS